MDKKYSYLACSSDVMLHENEQIREKLNQLRIMLKNEGIEIRVFDNKTVEVNFSLCGYLYTEKKRAQFIEEWISSTDKLFPHLDIEQLIQAPALDCFLTQLFVFIDYQQQCGHSLSKKALIEFHSQCKYLLMAYSQSAYRELGRYMANIPNNVSLEKFASEYQQKLMQALSVQPNRKGQTNTLMHIAGYFKRALDPEQKKALTQAILQYREGIIPFSIPFDLLKKMLVLYPDNYLIKQRYFSPYPVCFDYLREQL